MNFHKADDLVRAYFQAVGAPAGTLNRGRCTRLQFQDSLIIDMEFDESADCLQLYGFVGEMPGGDHQSLYRSLLEANMSSCRTHLGCLAMDPVSEAIVLVCSLGMEHLNTGLDLGDKLHRFCDLVDHWRGILREGLLHGGGSQVSRSSTAETSDRHQLSNQAR